MEWIGILTCLGILSSIFWGSFALVRIKDVRVKRVISTLEWLALNAGERRNDRWAMALETVRGVWSETSWVFSSSFSQYLSLVWNAKFRDLYWANRFGQELYSLSLSLFPSERLEREREVESERFHLIIQHVNDFTNIARIILSPKQERRNRDEI